MKADPLINSFSGGELSPKLDPRSDLQKYQTGCRVLENMIPLVEGGAQTRPGTYFVTEVKDSSKKVRLFPFQFSTVQAYIIEMGEEYIRFYKNNGQIVTAYAAWGGLGMAYALGTLVTNGANYYRCIVAHTSAAVFANDLASGYWVITGGATDLAYEIPSPYQESELEGIKVTQSADILYLAHRNHNIRKLSRTGDTAWTLTNFIAATSEPLTITGVTAANPAVVTVSGIAPAQTLTIIASPNVNPAAIYVNAPGEGIEFPKDGEQIHITGVTGMVELNDLIFTVAEANEAILMFRLSGIDTTAYGAYLGAGTITIPNRDVPEEIGAAQTLTITNATQANPCVITVTLSAGIEFPKAGEVIFIDGIVGMVELNGNLYTVATTNETAGTFRLSGVNSTAYTPYANSGTISIPNRGTTTRKVIPAAGSIVYIQDVQGMTEVNDRFFTVANPGVNTFQLEAEDSSAYTAYTSSGTVRTTQFGTTGNNPAAIAFFEQRFMTGGTNNNPLDIYGSASADYENFIQDAEDASSAINYALLSDKVDDVRWMLGEEYLMIGTQGGLWRLGASSASDPLTQDNVIAKRQIAAGCKDMDAEMVADAILYIQRGGTTVRRTEWSFERDKYTAQDVTRVSKHIAKGVSAAMSGITDMDYQTEPISILWAIRADGQLLGMVYEPVENIMAWFRIITDGTFESVACISVDDDEDQAWVIVNRTIENTTKRYIEYFKPHDFFDVYEDAFFVDSGLTWDGGAAVTITGITQASPAVVSAAGHGFTNGMKVRITDVEGMTQANQGLTQAYTVANAAAGTFELSGIDSTGWNVYTSGGSAQRVANSVSGLSHLNGESVAVLTNYGKHPARTVAAGAISLQFYANIITVGLPYTYNLQPMKFEPGTPEGTSRGRKKKIYALSVAFYQSAGVKWGPDAGSLIDVPFGLGAQPELFTGDKDTDFSMDYDTEASVYIQGQSPLPLTVLSVSPKMVVTDG